MSATVLLDESGQQYKFRELEKITTTLEVVGC
jgi:hypothetical protein